MPALTVNKNLVDVTKVYMTYLTLGGDIERTAHALQMERQQVLDLVRQEGWADKAKDLAKLADDDKGVQIQINRAINFVQAHRLRALLDKVVGVLSEHSPEELIEALTVNGKHGPEFKTRALTDLVKAAEACQLMTQRALGDTAAELGTEEGPTRGSHIALKVMTAMQSAEQVSSLDSAQLIRAHLVDNPPPAP